MSLEKAVGIFGETTDGYVGANSFARAMNHVRMNSRLRKTAVSRMKWLLALLLCLGAACTSAAQEVNGRGVSSALSTTTVPSPRPLPQAGEGGMVSLRDAHIKSFVRGSHQQIVSARAGKPFVITFWSLGCTNCRDDLAMFGKLVQKYRSFDLVLVATDTPEQKQEIADTLQHYRLGGTGPGRIESWVFADSYAERLRFEVDPQWYGELPRTYFYDAQGRVQALSGALDQAQIERWIREGGKNG